MLVRIIGGHGGVSPGFKATSYLIDGKLLLDAGSVASGIQIEEQANIDHILISHSHLDHISDLAFLADNCFGMKDRPFDIYANTPVKDAIKTHLLNDVIWPDFTILPSKEKPTLRFQDVVPNKLITLGDYNIIPVPVNHSLGALGFIIERKNATVIFTQDTGPTDEIWEEAKKIKNLKAIFTEVSFPNALSKVATDSCHHTAKTMKEEIKKNAKGCSDLLGTFKT
ncbi:MAG: 3',5'-cyclic-nucleotide phosphodiesterase [Bdellovibrionales bacterium]|nr:3',5'-cyclic-nucleotide phosphodiesterase [Bdellovibrionales bacterium]